MRKGLHSRSYLIALIFTIIWSMAIGRAFYLQVVSSDFLLSKGDNRSNRILDDFVMRGRIYDRNGLLLGASVEKLLVWAIPTELRQASPRQIAELCTLLNLPLADMEKKRTDANRSFVIIKRAVDPGIRKNIESIGVQGLFFARDSKRIYTADSEIKSIVGKINSSGNGISGIEMMFNSLLNGKRGQRKIVKDGRGNIVEELAETIKGKSAGDLKVSLDSRLQILSHVALNNVNSSNHLLSGIVVLVRPETGEILALDEVVEDHSARKYPDAHSAASRTFEPGLTLSPFIFAAGLQGGAFKPDTILSSANPGLLAVADSVHRPVNRRFPVSDILVAPNQFDVAVSGMMVKPSALWAVFDGVGFGRSTFSGLPGEASSNLLPREQWRAEDQAKIATGRRIRVTPIQLARAYAVLANGGDVLPLSMLALETPPRRTKVIQSETTDVLFSMFNWRSSVKDKISGAAHRKFIMSDANETTTLKNGLTEKRKTTFASGISKFGNTSIVGVVLLDTPFAQSDGIESVSRDLLVTIFRGSEALLRNQKYTNKTDGG